MDDAAYAEMMKEAGVPEPIVPFLVVIQQCIRQGALDVESADMEMLLGRPPTPIRETVRLVLSETLP